MWCRDLLGPKQDQRIPTLWGRHRNFPKSGVDFFGALEYGLGLGFRVIVYWDYVAGPLNFFGHCHIEFMILRCT